MTHDAALLERAEQFYDEKVGAKIEGFVDGNPRVERAWQTLERWVRPSPRRVLEIGCAIGDITWRMSQVWPSAEVVGLDVSSKSIALATKLFGGPRIEFVHGAVTAAALVGPFDVIVMLDVYEHIPEADRPTLHAALKRLLSEDGQIVLTFPTPEHLAWLREHDPGQIQPVDEDVTPQVIVDLAADSGTDVALYEKVSVWHCGDYAHAVLKRHTWRPDAPPVSDLDDREPRARLGRLFAWRNRTDRSRQERRQRVYERLGSEFYQGK